jgi:hypothetical protein
MGLQRWQAQLRIGRRQPEDGVAIYYFHLSDGHQALIDPDGREVADFNQIAALALQEARAMISQDALGGRIILNQFIEVRDEAGKLVHQLSFREAVKITGGEA